MPTPKPEIVFLDSGPKMILGKEMLLARNAGTETWPPAFYFLADELKLIVRVPDDTTVAPGGMCRAKVRPFPGKIAKPKVKSSKIARSLSKSAKVPEPYRGRPPARPRGTGMPPSTRAFK